VALIAHGTRTLRCLLGRGVKEVHVGNKVEFPGAVDKLVARDL
jgi:hypothetical protein